MPIPGYHPPMPERVRFALKLVLLTFLITLAGMAMAMIGPVR